MLFSVIDFKVNIAIAAAVHRSQNREYSLMNQQATICELMKLILNHFINKIYIISYYNTSKSTSYKIKLST